VSPDLNDVSHYLTREIAGLGSMHRAGNFQEIGDVSSLHFEYGNMPDSFRRSSFHYFSRATTNADHSGNYQGAEFQSYIHAIHGITT
jgi:hypothetical protein